MPTYRYTAKDQEGRSITGVSKVGSQTLLIDALRKKDLVIISVTQEKDKKKQIVIRGGIRLDDIVLFSRQLATMVDSGIPLLQSLDILTEQIENPSFRRIIMKTRNDVETGSSLSGALSKHVRVFSPLYINMVKAGESSGMLDDILDRLATYLEKMNALRRKVKSALIYPAVVVTMAILITTFLMLKVIPTFKGIFETLGGTLPLPTRTLIAVSDFLNRYFLYGVGVLILLVVALVLYTRTEKGRLNRDRVLMHLPIFGKLFQKATVARFSRTLSTLVKSGVPILSSLEIVGKSAGNKVIEMALEEARASIREGENIAGPLSKRGVFPPMVIRMIAVGEETGELEKMLSKISDFYEEQVEAAVAGLTSIIEPLIIGFLGVVVGGIVVSMFLPIFKLTELISK
ncbi:MAG: type II secretion system F family protein [Candidatus Omnitrophica bacterium]|nr:type II secretion system F family protein [Candidatus Omnitrophota bacterium]